MNDEPSVAVPFDRDGTLVEDVPYNGDPRLVKPMPGASGALALLRSRRIRVGVVSNQLLGPFDDFRYCPHTPEARCDCRKPAPGMVRAACAALGVLTAAARLVETLLRKDMA